ncbi:MAG: amidase [Pyrinomonadaceae bacterium]|nr:amidase [Pyrinomonadaceae bacterium]
MNELTTQSLTELAGLIRARKVSPVEVVEAHLRRIERLNPQLNAVVTLAPDALDAARRAEEAIMRGEAVGLLHGVPVTVKDTIQTKGLRTTAGSKMRAEFVPENDAVAVGRLRGAGAIVLGKTNVAEMAAAYDTENPVFGRANNPYDLTRTTGGSSGGEAAAIAACLSPGGLGSDLMGSIRVPAHFCGIVGLKPTIGRVSCDGHIPSSSGAASLGAVTGPMARHVEDVALLFRAIVDDSEAVSASLSDTLGETDVRGWRAAWYASDGIAPVTAETRGAVEAAARALADAGLNVYEARPPGVERGQDLWTKLFARAALLQMREEYRGREAEAGELVRYLLASNSDSPPPAFDDYARAWTERDYMRARLIEWMRETPLIIAPVGAMPAYEHGARKVLVEGDAVSIFRAFSYAQTYNVFGLPAVCVPAGRTREGLPVGVQIIGKPFAENSVLAAAKIVESALGGWQAPPLALPTDAQNRYS